METRISFPAGAVGPGMVPPFLVSSMRPGQGGVTGYGDINVSAMPNNQRVGPVRSPIGPVHGYRDQTAPLGPVAYVPTNIPGPIYPGVGPGSWHVGPTVVRDGRLPFGTYSSRYRRADAKMHTYGAAYGMDLPDAYIQSSVKAVLLGLVSGAVAGSLSFPGIPKLGAQNGALFGAGVVLLNQLFWGIAAKMAPEQK